MPCDPKPLLEAATIQRMYERKTHLYRRFGKSLEILERVLQNKRPIIGLHKEMLTFFRGSSVNNESMRHMDCYENYLTKLEKSPQFAPFVGKMNLEISCKLLIQSVKNSMNDDLHAQRMQHIFGPTLAVMGVLNPDDSNSKLPLTKLSAKQPNDHSQMMWFERELLFQESRFRFSAGTTTGSKHIVPPCTILVQIVDSKLPNFPPASLYVPEKYPSQSAQLILCEKIWSGSKLLQMIQSAYNMRLPAIGHQTIGALLDLWFYSINQAILAKNTAAD